MSKDFTHSVVILIITTVVVASFSLAVWVVPNILRTDDIAKGSLAKPLSLRVAISTSVRGAMSVTHRWFVL